MKKNIRELCLVLDLECRKVLPLITMESDELDSYIYENFEDSKAIRNQFKNEINEYLLKNKSYLEAVYKNSGRKTEGSIVILELNNNGYVTRKSVLYKKIVNKIENFLTIYSKTSALSKEDFIIHLLNQPNPKLFFSNYEIDVLKKEYKYFSKIRKQEFIYYLINDLKKRCFQNNDRMRDFYSAIKQYKPIKQQPTIKQNQTTIKTEDIEEIDPDKMYFDIPPFEPVKNDKIKKGEYEEKGYSLIYTYKPYHRR